MTTRFIVALVALMAVTACRRETVQTAPSNRQQAEKLMAQIRLGMTLAQVRVLVPHSSSNVFDGEHGGVWYDMPVGDDYIVQMRLAHPPAGGTLEQSTVNYSARLRDRKTLQFISGPEDVR